MSEIREIIENNYKAALKERSEIKIKTYRLIKSAIKDKDISLRTGDKKQEFSDDDIMKLLQTLIKQRNESYEMYKKGGRENLASIELEEINMPPHSFPCLITKNNNIGIPDKNSIIERGDKLLLVTNSDEERTIFNIFTGTTLWADL